MPPAIPAPLPKSNVVKSIRAVLVVSQTVLRVFMALPENMANRVGIGDEIQMQETRPEGSREESPQR